MEQKPQNQLKTIPKRSVELTTIKQHPKVYRTLTSFCSLSINYYLMGKVGVFNVDLPEELAFASTILLFIMLVVTYQEKDATYLFGAFAIFFCPFILYFGGISAISLVSIITTIGMLAFLRGINMKTIATSASNMAINFNQKKMQKKIMAVSGNKQGCEHLKESHLREFMNIDTEFEKVNSFYNSAQDSLKRSLKSSIGQLKSLRQDHARILMRSAGLAGFLETIDRNKLHHDLQNLSQQLDSAKDEVVKAQFAATIEMKKKRIEEIEKLDVCLQRIKVQRLQISEMFNGAMDKMNALKFTDIQTLEASSDAMYKDISSIRSDLENLEQGLIEAEKFNKI